MTQKEDLIKEYQKIIGKNVPNAYKNNLEWIQKKIDAKKAEDNESDSGEENEANTDAKAEEKPVKAKAKAKAKTKVEAPQEEAPTIKKGSLYALSTIKCNGSIYEQGDLFDTTLSKDKLNYLIKEGIIEQK